MRRRFKILQRKPQGFGNISPIGTAEAVASYLPEVYIGQAQRLERYNQYEIMDADPVVNAALNTIAEFCTQTEGDEELPFHIEKIDDMSDSSFSVINEMLYRWVRENKFQNRIFKIVRNTLKYGDQFFVRDPETCQWLWIDPAKVQSIIVDRTKGRKPSGYIVRGLDINLKALVATEPPPQFFQSIGVRAPGVVPNTVVGTPSNQSYYGTGATLEQFYIPAEHVIHLSLSDGMDNNWPFGTSILESVFKVYKQKELLEDAIIIYRVQRAPERRVFYIDVGNMPTHKAMEFVKRVKNEIHQRRIPNKSQTGFGLLDAAYNPLSILEDYFFAVTAEGRGSKVEVLPGGEQLGEIDDLLYFDRKLLRGLGVPIQYLPGTQEEQTAYTDGRVGTAYIQEYRFNKFCRRIQNQLIDEFDGEFKYYLRFMDVRVPENSFRLKFHEPQSFSKYRQIELDTNRISHFTSVAEYPFISKRFALAKYLGWTDEEILENEKKVLEEAGIDMYKGEDMMYDESLSLADAGIEHGDEDSKEYEELEKNLGPGTINRPFPNPSTGI